MRIKPLLLGQRRRQRQRLVGEWWSFSIQPLRCTSTLCSTLQSTSRLFKRFTTKQDRCCCCFSSQLMLGGRVVKESERCANSGCWPAGCCAAGSHLTNSWQQGKHYSYYEPSTPSSDTSFPHHCFRLIFAEIQTGGVKNRNLQKEIK